MTTTPKVSIVIPVFKVEQAIERCARSLFEQTFKELEYIFVNDCSPDKSILILEKVIAEYPESKDKVTICHHTSNKGVAASRNTGLDRAGGEYILQVDSDDWAEPAMVEELYKKAKAEDYDMVWSDFFVDFQDTKKSIFRKQNVPGDSASCIIEMLSGSLHAGLWNKLIKREICISNNLHFPDGVNMCEDLMFNVTYLVHAQRIGYINKAYYHYVQNANSITLARTRQSFESELKAVKMLEKNIPLETFGISLMKYKARIKRNMFISGIFVEDEFLNCFPESTPYIFLGLNKVDKLAIWLSLRRHFLLARLVLFAGSKYSKIKLLVR